MTGWTYTPWSKTPTSAHLKLNSKRHRQLPRPRNSSNNITTIHISNSSSSRFKIWILDLPDSFWDRTLATRSSETRGPPIRVCYRLVPWIKNKNSKRKKNAVYSEQFAFVPFTVKHKDKHKLCVLLTSFKLLFSCLSTVCHSCFLPNRQKQEHDKCHHPANSIIPVLCTST